MSLHYERTELRKTEQQIQNASIKHFPFLRVCIIESQIRYLKVIQNRPFFLLLFAKLFLGSESFCFDFFSFGYSWDYFVLYNEQVFFSTFFTIYNESKFMQNYPKGFWLCLVCVLIHFLTLWAALTLYGKQTFLYASFLSNICTSNLDLLYIQRKLPWKCHSLDS